MKAPARIYVTNFEDPEEVRGTDDVCAEAFYWQSDSYDDEETEYIRADLVDGHDSKVANVSAPEKCLDCPVGAYADCTLQEHRDGGLRPGPECPYTIIDKLRAQIDGGPPLCPVCAFDTKYERTLEGDYAVYVCPECGTSVHDDGGVFDVHGNPISTPIKTGE